jgi:hypothetical protein
MCCFTQHFLRLGCILTARFRVLCTDCSSSLVLHFKFPLQRQSRPLQLLCRHHYMHRYIFLAYFTRFHKFLETVNRVLTSSTNLLIKYPHECEACLTDLSKSQRTDTGSLFIWQIPFATSCWLAHPKESGSLNDPHKTALLERCYSCSLPMSVVSSNGIPLENRVFAYDICQLSSYMKRHCKRRWRFPDVPGPITTIYKYVVKVLCNSFHSKP